MRERGRPRPAWQDELLERRQRRVVLRDPFIDTSKMRLLDHRMTGNAELAAEIEEIVLDGRQRGANIVWQRFAQQHAELRIQFIDIPNRRDPRVVLLHAAAVAEAGRAVVAGARRYLA